MSATHLGSDIEIPQAHKILTVVIAVQPLDMIDRHQRIAMDTDEAAIEFLLQIPQGLIKQGLAVAVVGRNVFVIGLKQRHFRHRHQIQTAAVARRNM